MRRIFLVTFLVLIFNCSAYADWRLEGKDGNTQYAKTVGEFGAQIIFTDDIDELFIEWEKDQDGVYSDHFVDQVAKNKTLGVFIVFSNCAANPKGMCNVIVDFEVSDPAGKRLSRTRSLEVWVNKPALPEKNLLGLSVDHLILDIKELAFAGTYKVNAMVRDKNSKAKLSLERNFTVLN